MKSRGLCRRMITRRIKMSSKRLRFISLIGFALIAGVIGISLFLTYAVGRSKEIDLPVASAGSAADASDGANNAIACVSVTTDNVQAVIATFQRPESYTRDIRIESFFSDGSAAFDFKTTVVENNTALKKSGPDGKTNIILVGGKRYFWYDGDSNYTVRTIDSAENENKYSDEYQMILTYEDVLELDKSSITDAGFKEYNGENCIAVTYVSGQLKYTTISYISVKNGLLTGTEQYAGEMLIYRMTTSNYRADVTGLSAFDLPDGKNAFSSP